MTMDDMNPTTEMPRYQSHKKVWALKIAAIADDPGPDGGAVVTPADAGYAPFKVSVDYLFKHQPKVGGYYVVYDDGYKSWSPAEAFEGGYTRI
jgi:hypothetical protein